MSTKSTRNAWSKPLAGKAPPGLASPPGLTPKKPSVNYIMRERFLHLQLSLIGQNVTITLKSGAVIEGVLHCSTLCEGMPDEHRNKYVIRAPKVIKGEVDVKGGTLIVSAEKVSNLHIKSIRLEHARGGDAFQTDTDISAGGAGVKDDLVMAGNSWTSAGAEKAGNGRAGMFGTKNNELSGGIGEWNQFEANEKQFGVKASFDENLYTIELDKKNVNKKKQFEAERLAKEIEGQTTSNMHLAEERGQAVEGDYDEEDLYSGVLVTDKQVKERSKLVLKPRSVDAAKTAPAAQPANKAPVAKSNWAAMVAKSNAKPAATIPAAKTVPKTTPATEETKSEPLPQAPEEKATEEKANEKKESEPKDKSEKEAEKPKEEKPKETDEEKKEKPKSKLNANAKSFSFNPSAKSFTPSFGAPAPAPAPPVPVEQPQMVMMQPQYMHQYPGGVPQMMYPGAYPPQMQYRQGGPYPMMQQMPQQAGSAPTGNEDPNNAPQGQSNPDTSDHTNDGETEPKTEGSEEAAPASQDGEKSQDESNDQAGGPQNGQMPMYPGGPGYYPGMPMPGRGPGQYHPQMVGQQIPVVPTNFVYRVPPQHMPQGGMPQYNQMRGPGAFPGQQQPYMQGGYPGRPMEGEDMGYRGGGRGGRGGRGRRQGGRGRGKYNNNNNNYNNNRNQDSAQKDNAQSEPEKASE